MAAVRLNPMLRLLWRVHRAVLRFTRGRFGSRMGAFRVLLLETIGHRSGRPRTVALSHVERDGSFYVVGSYAGEHRDPAWAENLRAAPRATVSVRGRKLEVVARELDGSDLGEVFQRFVERDPAYAEYRARTARRIPVFELRPPSS